MTDCMRAELAYDVPAIVADMNRRGYGVIENFMGRYELQRVRAFVETAVQASGGEYVAFTGTEQLAGSGLDALDASASFRDLIKNIYETGIGRPAPSQPLYNVLRCLAGSGSAKNSYMFHYDSYVISALMPIVVPTSGLSGDLLMLPNTRSIRSHYIFNVIDKLLLDNRLTQRVLKWLTLSGRLPVTRIKMVPGNMYFFWGYRSIHTNEPCDPDKIRSTALFHFANPHKPVPAASSAQGRPVQRHTGVAALGA